jgi:dTDP-4-amino-4,6-dideoxygalactose transaminase
VWNEYSSKIKVNSKSTIMQIPISSKNIAHLFYVYFSNKDSMRNFYLEMNKNGIRVATHYEPLDSSLKGSKISRTPFEIKYSKNFSEQMIRLPLWKNLDSEQISAVCTATNSILQREIIS